MPKSPLSHPLLSSGEFPSWVRDIPTSVMQPFNFILSPRAPTILYILLFIHISLNYNSLQKRMTIDKKLRKKKRKKNNF